MAILSKEQIAEIKERAELANPGPWYNDACSVVWFPKADGGHVPWDCDMVTFTKEGWLPHIPTQVFVQKARTDIPNLIETVEELQEANEWYKVMIPNPYSSNPMDNPNTIIRDLQQQLATARNDALEEAAVIAEKDNNLRHHYGCESYNLETFDPENSDFNGPICNCRDKNYISQLAKEIRALKEKK